MSRSLLIPVALCLLPFVVEGCNTAPPAAAPTDPPPTILVTYTSPAVTASTAPAASSAPPSARPSATPMPTAERVESNSFFFTRPVGWTIEAQSASPERVALKAADGRSTFSVAIDPVETLLSKRKAAAVAEAGPGILTNTSVTVDQVPGYYLTSNRDTADGKRYVVEYGFAYRAHVYVLQGRWDKREANAEAISQDVQAIVKSFKWL